MQVTLLCLAFHMLLQQEDDAERRGEVQLSREEAGGLPTFVATAMQAGANQSDWRGDVNPRFCLKDGHASHVRKAAGCCK